MNYRNERERKVKDSKQLGTETQALFNIPGRSAGSQHWLLWCLVLVGKIEISPRNKVRQTSWLCYVFSV